MLMLIQLLFRSKFWLAAMVLKNGKRVGVWNTKDVTQEEIVRYMFIGANQESVENGAY